MQLDLIFKHNVYDNVRTRVIVIHDGAMLMLSPHEPEAGWQLPGGGLQPDESLAECGEREVYEETRIHVCVTGVAFLREFVVPKYCPVPDSEGVGFGLEVYLYARPATDQVTPQQGDLIAQTPHWIPFAQIPTMPVWPKELKALAALLEAGHRPLGIPSFVTELESPWEMPPADTTFAR